MKERPPNGGRTFELKSHKSATTLPNTQAPKAVLIGNVNYDFTIKHGESMPCFLGNYKLLIESITEYMLGLSFK